VRVVAQRVTRARVTPGGAIEHGLCLLVGVSVGDDEAVATAAAGKVARLRIFPDDDGRFDRSLLDTGGAAIVVSQLTLLADTRKCIPPRFCEAARPERAAPLVEGFATALRELGVPVETGVFGAHMVVELANDGPVTIVLDV
jgi:D-tyrosyl-tRNA(Tyr) deacylase